MLGTREYDPAKVSGLTSVLGGLALLIMHLAAPWTAAFWVGTMLFGALGALGTRYLPELRTG